jgi:imidazole glycerol-phosphate synthase subunit HisF
MIPRIIARLDIKNSNLVKGIHLEGFRVIGDPMEFALSYYNQGADEIMFQDVVASLYERNQLFELITHVAKNIFIPITVGGGIRSLDDIQRILHSGADKVSINTQAIRDPNFIYEAAKTFGSSTISLNIETIKNESGDYLVYSESGREETGLELVNWINKVQDLGAGELIITSVDNEGTGKGFDLDLMNLVNDNSFVPVIAHGGGGNPKHIFELLKECQLDGVIVASMIHYDAIISTDLSPKEEWGNTSFLNNPSNLITHSGSLQSIKKILHKGGIDVR